jgi:phosphate transport system substrate-binding protein
VDAIFSKTRKGGFEKGIAKWGELDLAGAWQNAPISLYGRNSASGTYGYFKEHALFKGDFKDSVKEQPGSSAVIQAVAGDKFAIGYSGIGYKTADVIAVALAESAKAKPVPATIEYAYTGEYPLSRFLNIAINYKEGTKLDPLRAEFIKYILSREGQEVVVKDNYFPITAPLAKKLLGKVGLAAESAGSTASKSAAGAAGK